MSRTISRRKLLGGTAGVIALGWLHEAFAAERGCGPRDRRRGLAALSTQYRRALAAHRKLLVLVIPESRNDRYERGAIFGQWLSHGSDEQLAPLAACEVVCVTMAHLRVLVPGAGDGEPMLVLVDPATQPTVVRRSTPNVPPPLVYRWRLRDTAESDGAYERAIDERIAVIAGAARALIASYPSDVTNAAAEVRERVAHRRIAGSRWARQGACGTYFEDPEPDDGMVSFGCGMGHLPERAQRFLYLYASVREEWDLESE